MCTDPSLPIFLIEHTPNFVFGVYKNADPDMHDCCIFFYYLFNNKTKMEEGK